MSCPYSAVTLDVDTLLACPSDQRDAWIAAHANQANMELLAALKQRSDSLLLTDPITADQITRLALQVAHYVANEPLALALARWARGNWEAYHDPQTAIHSYQQALAGYQSAGDLLSAARLWGNLVFVYADSGRFVEAQGAYESARAVFVVLGDTICEYDVKEVANSPDSMLGVRKVDDPREFGVAEMDEKGYIDHVVEKP